MSATLLLLSVVAFQNLDYREWKPFVRIDEYVPSGFKFDGETYSRSARVYYVEKGSSAALDLTARLVPSDKTVAEGWTPWLYIAGVGPNGRFAPSRLPLGDDAYHHFGPKSAFVSATLDRAVAEALSSAYRGGQADAELAEGAVRYVLANLAGRGYRPGGATKVGGVPVLASFTSPEGRSVAIDAWSRASGRTVEWDKRRGLATFKTKGGTKVTLALAAKGYRRGETWVSTEQPVARKDGHWLVPVATLEAID